MLDIEVVIVAKSSDGVVSYEAGAKRVSVQINEAAEMVGADALAELVRRAQLRAERALAVQ